LFRGQSEPRIRNIRDSAGRRWGPGWVWLVLFGGGLFGLPLWAANNQDSTLAVIDGFYRAGSLVFGGGHVVLPLLDAFTVGQGWIGADTFLAGYGAAQALPGPLFAFTSFLGTSISAGPGGIGGGVLALVATYVPSWLLLLGVLPYWEKLRRLATAQAILKGANAAVVGLLLAAFFNPIWATAVTSSDRLAFALLAFGALRYAKLPPWALVLICGGAGAAVF
jgi:chromate transporter